MVRASADPSAQLARGESLHTEFKAWPIMPDDLAAAIVAFANTDGGRIFLGVDDLGVAVGGIGDLDRATQFVDNVAFNNCSPPVTVLQETVETAGGTVLAVNVPKGDDRPYRTNRGVHYIRTSSGRRHASRGELLRLFQASESLFYDETPIRRSTPSDRDESATDEMLEAIQELGLDLSGIPRDRLLCNWGLIDDDEEIALPWPACCCWPVPRSGSSRTHTSRRYASPVWTSRHHPSIRSASRDVCSTCSPMPSGSLIST